MPDPDGPTIASSSPALDVEVDVAQRVHGRLARVPATDPAQLDDPVRPVPAGGGGGRGHRHHHGVPAASPSPRTSTQPSSNRPVSTRDVRARAVVLDDLDRVAALEQRDERADRHGQDVVVPSVTTAWTVDRRRVERRQRRRRDRGRSSRARSRRRRSGRRSRRGRPPGSCPSTSVPSGSSTVTAWPGATRSWRLADRSSVTTRDALEASSTGAPGPTLRPTVRRLRPATRIAPGRNTTSRAVERAVARPCRSPSASA